MTTIHMDKHCTESEAELLADVWRKIGYTVEVVLVLVDPHWALEISKK